MSNAFAAWRSKRDGVTYRLPTEEEWEYAARNGDRNDLYPWGNEWKDKQACAQGSDAHERLVLSRTGRTDGASSDLIGNVWEWTSSKVSLYPGNRTPFRTAQKDWVVIRGGGYELRPVRQRQSVSSCIRAWFPPQTRDPNLGFRLVRSAQ